MLVLTLFGPKKQKGEVCEINGRIYIYNKEQVVEGLPLPEMRYFGGTPSPVRGLNVNFQRRLPPARLPPSSLKTTLYPAFVLSLLEKKFTGYSALPPSAHQLRGRRYQDMAAGCFRHHSPPQLRVAPPKKWRPRSNVIAPMPIRHHHLHLEEEEEEGMTVLDC